MERDEVMQRLRRWLFGCRHEWEIDPTNGAKRTCKHCGEHQWMFVRPIWTDGPAIRWETMGRKDPERLRPGLPDCGE